MNLHYFKQLKQRARENGQGLVEYALILVLVAVVVIAILSRLGPQIGNIFSKVMDTLNKGSGAAACTITLTSTYPGITVTVPSEILTHATLNAGGFEWQGGGNLLVYTAYTGAQPDPELAMFNNKSWFTNIVAKATGNCAPLPNL